MKNPKVDMTVLEDLLKRLNDATGDEDCGEYELTDKFIYRLCVEYHGDMDEEILAEFEYELLDSEESGEGGGEDCYGVFKLRDKFYRAEYKYYSYYGHDYDYILDTLCEVKPVEKTITVYETI